MISLHLIILENNYFSRNSTPEINFHFAFQSSDVVTLNISVEKYTMFYHNSKGRWTGKIQIKYTPCKLGKNVFQVIHIKFFM